MPKKGYHHLTSDQRCQIEALKGILSGRAIAVRVGVHFSTVSRELSRNSSMKGCYFFKIADRLARGRRRLASARPRRIREDHLDYIKARLADKWSPEQIAGYCKAQGLFRVSHESIYQMIWQDKRTGGGLYQHLRHAGKKYYRRRSKAGRSHIPHRVDITHRPAIVEQKCRIGDVEGDTLIGAKRKGAILSHVDRHSKFTKLALLKDKTAASVLKGVQASLEPLKAYFHTITYDNGSEFSGHREIAKILHADCFFARPYHSWERGLNEHTNGLIRQYFPKKTPFDTLTQTMVQEVEDALNARPRKSLGFKTPQQVFFSSA